ncbi:DUF1934 domain-containing protein [Cohnella sp.]|uniref:DUF1934 domain-containing protein n=1 Tax=Cohnella sp. TaxID=1883426 RepID=UPI003567766A
MPDKRSVNVEFKSWQPDGGSQQSILQGELHRLVTGWALTYKEPMDEAGNVTAVTMIIHERELRLRRRGAISLEQVFQTGFTLPGRMETPYGPQDVEALTSRLDINLSENGGVIEWEYELLMQDQAAGSFHIRLDIREEEAG